MNKEDNKPAVLITGAGGAAVPALITLLQNKGYRVIAADMDSYAVGLYLADKGFVVPAGNSDSFVPVLREICRKERVKAIVPLVDEELLSAHELEGDGVAVLLPRKEFVRICLDKFLLMKSLTSSGIRVPKTRLVSEGLNGVRFPCVIKPRVGRGSRGLGIIHSDLELRAFIDSSPYPEEALIIQEHIEGVEFTTSVVVWQDGVVNAVIPKEIIYKKGITRIAVTRRNAEIDLLCRRIQRKLRADGPFNVQLRLENDSGEAIPFEINPRFSTTITLTVASGVDELGYLLQKALDTNWDQELGTWSEGIVLLRKTGDQFISEEDFLSCHIVRM